MAGGGWEGEESMKTQHLGKKAEFPCERLGIN